MSEVTSGQASRDTFGRSMRDLRISVTDRCNFRCPYCMPSEVYGEHYRFLPRAELLTFEEIERLAARFVHLGVRKIRLTGGEPLLRADLPALVGRLVRIADLDDLTLTTNGVLLPDHAEALARAGLKRLTVSLDSLDPLVFARMSGNKGEPARVLAGIAAAEAAGFASIKINCVVQRGVNDHTLLDLAEHFRGTGHIVRFIEFMDVGNLNGWAMAQVVTAAEILALIGKSIPLASVPSNYIGEVARRYRYTDGSGEIGIIASVSQPFCGDCTRARLTTDGKLVTCLFASGGHDLRELLRSGASDEAIDRRIDSIWRARQDRYSEERSAVGATSSAAAALPRKIEMFQIGG